MSDWFFDHVDWFVGIVVVVTVLAIPFIIWHEHKEKQACQKRGGSWQVVGHHTQVSNTTIGNHTTTTVYDVNDYGCVMPQ